MLLQSIAPGGREWQRLVLVAAMAVLVLGGLAGTVQPAQAATGTTTASLNLREGPGTSFLVVQVIPSGAAVEVTGTAQFGFLPVSYAGASGWASAGYLTTGAATAGTASGTTSTRYVFDGRLNLRSGPGMSYGVLAVMPDEAPVSLAGETANGFSKLTWNGTVGWAASQYLASSVNSGTSGSTPGPPTGDMATGTVYTLARVIVRSGPGTSHGAKTVIPSGVAVDVMGSPQSGFTPVRYDGVAGWASSAYLTSNAPGSTTGSTPESGTVTGKVTTAAVNLRSGPGTGTAVLRVLPPATAVNVTGAEQDGFVPVTWGTLKGHVSTAFLTDPGSANDPGASTAGDQEIIAIIYAAADRWGQPRADMLRVARCESNLDPSVVNRSSGASGLFQFMPSTFAFTPNGKRGENIFDAYSSADAAGWMWANGMRNHWECQ